MSSFLVRHNLLLISALAAGVALYTALNWAATSTMETIVRLFFVGVVLHLWEEQRFPGGFAELITRKLDFTAKNRHFGEIVTIILVLFLAVVPIVVPGVAFLQLAALLLGYLEAVAHVLAIRMFRLPRPYSPGMATALLVLLPLSIWGTVYATGHGLVSPIDWLWAVLYALGGLLLAQRYVVTASGMRYREFLRNVRASLRAG